MAAALAICGAAWLGGIAVVASVGVAGVPLPGLASVRLPVPALGMLVALAAAPVLLVVVPEAGAPAGVATLAAGAVGLAAAAVAAWAVARSPIGPAFGAAHAPRRPAAAGLAALAPAFASAAAGIGIGIGIGGWLDGGGSGGGLGSLGNGAADTFPRAAVLAAGGALITAAVPTMLLDARRGRRDAVAIAVAGASLAAMAFADAPAFLGAAGSVLAAVALVSGRPFAPPSLDRLGTAIAAVAAVAVPLAVAVAGIALLRAEAGSVAAAAGGPGGHEALVLATVGSAGAGFLALAERAVHPRRSPMPLLVAAIAVAGGALALLVTDAITGCLIAAAAAALFGTLARAETHRPRADRPGAEVGDDTASVVGATVLATVALASLGFASTATSTDPGPVGGFAGLAVAAAVAVRLGAIPFHRAAIAVVDRTPAALSGLATGWLAAVFAFVALAGLASATAVPRPLDGPEAALVAFVAVITIVLGGIASLVQERLAHALAYLLAAQSGWAVLAVVSPAAAWPALGGWLPAFAAAGLALGAVALVAEQAPGPSRVADLGRSTGEAAVEVIALVAAGLALLGLPGLPSWEARVAIGRAAVGDGAGADALLVVGALVVLVAVARLVARAAGPLVLAGSLLFGQVASPIGRSRPRRGGLGAWAAASGSRLGRSGWRIEGPAWREAIADGGVVGLVAAGLVALLAGAVGLGFVG